MKKKEIIEKDIKKEVEEIFEDNNQVEKLDIADPKQETIKRNKEITRKRNLAHDLRKKSLCGELA